MSDLHEMLIPIYENSKIKGEGVGKEGKIYRYKWKQNAGENSHGEKCICQIWMGKQIRYLRIEEEDKWDQGGYAASPYPAYVSPSETEAGAQVHVFDSCLGKEMEKRDECEIEIISKIKHNGFIIHVGGIYDYKNPSEEWHDVDVCEEAGCGCPCTSNMLNTIDRVKIGGITKGTCGCYYLDICPVEEDGIKATVPDLKKFRIKAGCLDLP